MVKSKISCSYKFSFFNKIFCNFMAGSTVWKVKLLYVLVLYVPIWKGEGAKLNAPKVLLPYYRDVIVNFTLKVERSLEEFQATTCYEWRSTRPEVAKIHLLNSTDGVCAMNVIVSSISKSSHQMTTLVIAENRVTKETLRCNVIVGGVARLEIETTTRILYLEDSPEELVVRGFDSEGNVFSSMDGLSFEWTIISDNEVMGEMVTDASSILRMKRFAVSHYVSAAHIRDLEDRGLQGDTILVEGIRTGSARCLARLRDTVAMQSVEPSSVRIVVVANIILSPSEAYILRYSRFNYTVELLRYNSMKQISMPSDHYYLQVQHADICLLEAATSTVTAIDFGSTEIVLIDANIAISEVFIRPSALVHVVEPGSLRFIILRYRTWALVTGSEYDVSVQVYDKDGHKIYLTSGVRVVVDFPAEYFSVISSSRNGTHHRIRTSRTGRTVVYGKLTGVVDHAGVHWSISPEVKGQQEVEILDPIMISPAAVYFPWHRDPSCQHSIVARATGGSGEYVWSSSNVSRVVVSSGGEITALGSGVSNISAADAVYAGLTGTMSVFVLPPTVLSFRPGAVEAPVGSILSLSMVVTAMHDNGTEVSLTDCRHLPLTLSCVDVSVFQPVESETQHRDSGCVTFHLMALHQGHTEVTVSLHSAEEASSLQTSLQTSITIAAFNVLKVLGPEEEPVVAMATSMAVICVGGPQPWVLDSSSFFRSLSAENRNVSIYPVRRTGLPNGVFAFRVLCAVLGEQVLKLHVGNGVSRRNTFPVTSSLSVVVMCHQPVEIDIYPRHLRSWPTRPPCPINPEQPVPVHSGKELQLLVTVMDNSGRHFLNFSSVALRWTVTNSSLLTIVHQDSLRRVDSSSTDTPRHHPEYYQTLRPMGKTGSAVVTVTASTYLSRYVKLAGILMPTAIQPAISKSIELLLADEAVISPSTVSVFNHPSNQVSIKIEKGSGYFYLEPDNSTVIHAAYMDRSKSVVVRPVKDGVQSVTVTDLCLNVDSHPLTTVHVSSVGSVHVSIVDKVALNDEVKAMVQMMDTFGHNLLASYFAFIDLRLQLSSKILSITPRIDRNLTASVSSVYIIRGIAVGHTTITAIANLPDNSTVYSVSRSVEVFPPLRLEPRNVTLIVGATLQVMAHGGPQPVGSVHLSITDSTLGSVSSSGLLRALSFGTTTLIGKAVGIDSTSGDSVVYSQDAVNVSMVRLTSVRIRAPLSRLQTGATMPVYAVGATEHETPISFGSCQPPLTFRWSVSGRGVVLLRHVYDGKGITLGSEYSFTQQIVAKETGHVTVTLVVEVTDPKAKQIYGVSLQDAIQIQVFDRLRLTDPTTCDGRLLVTPNTEIVLRTNRDSAAILTYYVMNSGPGDHLTLPAVRISGAAGRLMSGSASGGAVVQATARERFGVNQTLVFFIQVKPVSYLMVNLDTVLWTRGGPLAAVPMGITLQFSVTYHDDVGDTFHSTNVQIGFRSSRYDQVHVSNGVSNHTIMVRASDEGHTTLMVWDRQNPRLADYVSIPVQPAITPLHPITVLGSVICFSTAITMATGDFGHWTSVGRSIRVDSRTGVGQSVSVGQSTVTYTTTSPDITISVMVRVVGIEVAELKPPVGHLVASPTSPPVFTPVKFFSRSTTAGNDCNTTEPEHQLAYDQPLFDFRCDLQLHGDRGVFSAADIFHVSSVFQPSSGKHGCLVRPVSTSPLPAPVATLEASVELRVTVPTTDGWAAVRSPPAVFALMTEFHVHNPEVHLTDQSPIFALHLSATPRVLSTLKITVSDSSLLEVLPLDADTSPGGGGLAGLPVRLRESLSLWERGNLDASLVLASAVTGQEVTVPVHVKLLGQRPEAARLACDQNVPGFPPSLFDYHYLSVIFVIVFATAASAWIGYRALIGSRRRAVGSRDTFLNQTCPVSPHMFLQTRSSPGSPHKSHSSSPVHTQLWSVNYSQEDSTLSSPKRRPLFTSFSKS